MLRRPEDWVQCENLPSPDAKCWQEGGPTLFTLTARRRAESQEAQKTNLSSQDEVENQTPTKQTSKS